MAISIDWGNTFVISVPQADLSFVSGALYDFDTDAFRLELKSLEDDVEGMPWTSTHIHNTEVTVFGVTYARFIEIVAPYSITFEDTGSAYTIRAIGSNNNCFDADQGILNPTPLVSYLPTNSAGLIVVETADGAAIDAKLTTLLAAQDLTNEQTAARHITDPATSKLILRNATVMRRWEADAWEDAARSIPYRGRVAGIEESGGLEAVDDLVEVAWV